VDAPDMSRAVERLADVLEPILARFVAHARRVAQAATHDARGPAGGAQIVRLEAILALGQHQDHLPERLAPVAKWQPNASTSLSCRLARDGLTALELNDVPIGPAQAGDELSRTHRVGTDRIQPSKTINHI